jgi:NAD(P)-dependent dehydrogenase (short-subunit alcohol dehydrogenase family)
VRYDKLLEGRNASIIDRRGDGVADAIRSLFIEHGACLGDTSSAHILVYIAPEPPKGAPDLSFREAFLLTREALPHMMQSFYGSLIYLQATCAIEALARAGAMDVCKFAVRANCVRYDLHTDGVLGAPATAEDAANAALYLASPLSRIVSGEVLYADAGALIAKEGAHVAR